MDIYNDLSNNKIKEFEKLLSDRFSKSKNIIEGKIIEGKITKITEKFVLLFVDGLKSEPIVDINELKSIGLEKKINVVTANKALLSKHGTELFEIAEKNNVLLLYEAAVAGGIPIIRVIKDLKTKL